MVRATPYASNSQSSKTAVNEGNAIGKRRMKDDLTEAVNIQNQLEMRRMAWAKKCSVLWIKSVEIRTRRVSRVLASAFYIGGRFKKKPAGRHALESDNNGYL